MTDLIAMVTAQGLWVVFGTTLAKRIGVPVPAAPFLVVAGALSMAGQISWLASLAVAVLANVIGDGAWFLAGRVYGHRVMKLLCRISLSPDSCVRQSSWFFSRWGGSSLLAAKFVPGISVVAPPMAGALGMSVLAFLAFESVAAALWAGLFLGIGMLFSKQIQRALDLLSSMGLAALGVLAVLGAAYVAVRYWRRQLFLREAGITRVSVDELRRLMASGTDPVVIDVRGAAGRSMDLRRIPGALPVEPRSAVRDCRDLAHDREIVVYCDCPGEESSARVARLLAANGFKRVRPLLGGLEAWVAAGLNVDQHTLTDV